MQELADASQGMHVIEGVLVAQAPDSIEDAPLRSFQSGLLRRVHATSPPGVIIDVSRVRLLDSFSYTLLANAGRMAAMLGARVVFAGFQPGVVSTLMDLDVDTSALTTVLSLEDGMELLRPLLRARVVEEADEEPGGDAQDDLPDGAEAQAEPGQGAEAP